LKRRELGVAIKAVIWDFGGVFTTSPFEAFNRFEASRGLPADLIRTINATNPHENAWALFERSEIDAAGFDAMFAAEAKALGHDVRGADVLPLLSGDLRPRVVRALELCRERFTCACITNNIAGAGHGAGMAATAETAARVSDVMASFDAVIESSKIGIRKPDPRIYQMMCELLEVAPAACVYIDDLGVNCKPAAELGMTAIKFVSEDQAMADLGRVTGLEL
jgi:putative hydrolase of the HAD superfamily